MARTWLSVQVEMLGGRGEEFWPAPGRIFAVGPSHTFMDLASAISTAFARWDHSHLDEFTLRNGSLITYQNHGIEAAGAPFGPLLRVLDIHKSKVMRTVALGEEFKLIHDLGDEWLHRCTVGSKKIDPLDTLGIIPEKPLPYWGWGSMPDQYGRVWAEDDGENTAPQPSGSDPMLGRDWPTDLPPLDLREVKASIAAADGDRLLEAIVGREINEALTVIAEGAHLLLQKRTDAREAIVFSVLNRLMYRGEAGDQALADVLLAMLREG